MKQTPLAWLNLLHEKKVRTLVAMAGVAFAIILILMQLGFYYSVRLTASLVYDKLDFDLLLASHDYLYMVRSGIVPAGRYFRRKAYRRGADAAVRRAQHVAHPDTGHERGILFGHQPGRSRVSAAGSGPAARRASSSRYHVLMDRCRGRISAPASPARWPDGNRRQGDRCAGLTSNWARVSTPTAP